MVAPWLGQTRKIIMRPTIAIGGVALFPAIVFGAFLAYYFGAYPAPTWRSMTQPSKSGCQAKMSSSTAGALRSPWTTPRCTFKTAGQSMAHAGSPRKPTGDPDKLASSPDRLQPTTEPASNPFWKECGHGRIVQRPTAEPTARPPVSVPSRATNRLPTRSQGR